jgi:hypothetical protein
MWKHANLNMLLLANDNSVIGFVVLGELFGKDQCKRIGVAQQGRGSSDKKEVEKKERYVYSGPYQQSKETIKYTVYDKIRVSRRHQSSILYKCIIVLPRQVT